MDDLALHILDIAENSINAGAKNVTINIIEDTKEDLLMIEIIDDGKGIEKEILEAVTNPFVTSRTTRKVGLGLPLLKLAAENCEGGLEIKSEKGKGTQIKVKFKHSHIDRQPLGDVMGTILALLANEHNINVNFFHRKDERTFEFDSKEFKSILENLALEENSLITVANKYLKENYNNFKTN
ncbi:MAG: ATP-binding protein [Ignavibacteria bacterium]|nr:ATP-binding protein [Ignavibacteria bacterium]